jgi:hypothetical protein
MSIPILQPPEQHWLCPNCTATAVTRGQPNRYHQCAGLKSMLAPMTLEGHKVKVEAVEREDYIGSDVGNVTLDAEGRPIMAVVTTRDDGNDCAVFAPVATGKVEA